MPLLYPTRKLTHEELDRQLAAGRRRSGTFLYYTACDRCSACEPTRLEVQSFALTRSLRRIWNLGQRIFRTEIGPPGDDATRLSLFNRHRLQRHLSASDEAYSFDDFQSFLVDTCCASVELSYWADDQLVGCTILDCGNESISAVYTYFDPDFAKCSPGSYSILSQIDWARREGKRYLYLGMYVADNQHLRYKARFAPQERYIQGQWLRFDAPLDDWARPASGS